MSQQGRLVDLVGTLETLTGNSGGVISPDGVGNIDVVGSAPISVTGNPGSFSLTIDTDGTLATTYTGDSGTATAAADNINIVGTTSVAGTSPLVTSAAGSTVTVTAQISQAIAAADTTKLGICNFDSAEFSVDVDGFVTLVGGTIAMDSFTPDSGTNPVVPTGAGLVAMSGSGSITTVGSLNTLTTQLTGLTQYNVLVGAGSTTIAKVAPGATGIPLVSQGAAAEPAFSTAVVAGGGTGSTSLTDGGILLGSGTGAVTVTSQPTNGQLLIGSTGIDPVLGSLSSSGGTVVITEGAGTINLETGASISDSFSTDSGTATPAAGVLTVAGGTNINTAGAASTATVNLDTTLTGLTTVFSTTFDTNVTAAGVTLAGTTLAADGTDANIDITLSPKGTGEVISTLNFKAARAESGSLVQILSENTSNTASSDAVLVARVGGSSAGDAYINCNSIGTAASYSFGLEQTSDEWVMGRGGDLTSTPIIVSTAAGEVTMPLQPAFLAYLPTSDLNVSGTGGFYTLGATTALTEVYDRNGDFVPSTGVFTAPVTGIYHFDASIYFFGLTAANSFQLDIITSNATYGQLTARGLDGVGQDFQSMNDVDADMDAADTCTFAASVSGEAGVTADVAGQATVAKRVSRFSGRLVI